MIAFPMTKSVRLAAVLAPVLLGTLTLPAVAESKFKQFTTPGGISAWMVEDQTFPIISMSFAFEAGATKEPAEKAGVAGLTAAVMTEATAQLDPNQLAAKVEEVGLDLQLSADKDYFWGSARTTSDHADEAFALMAEVLNEPRFAQDDLDRVRRIAIENIRRSAEDPSYRASLLWNTAIYGDHPYARPTIGTEETLTAIVPEDLRAFYKAGLSRDTLKIGIIGAVTEAEAGAIIDKAFGALPEKSTLPTVATAEVNIGETLAVAYPLPQTSLRITYPGIAIEDPDYYPAQVLVEMLAGGGLSSILNTEVREKRGLSYGVSGGLANFRYSNLITFGTSTEPQNAAEAQTVINDIFKQIAEEGPTQEQVDLYKRYLIGSYAINNLGSTGGLVGTMVSNQLLNLPLDYVDTRTELIEAVTPERVQAVAKRIFGITPTILTVGPEAAE
ncbi:insulinase family protein [Devosia sp. MC532]|uniref:insulinase family protein n=1 Tax=Devosia sp. MC532 TaxID=2799788 RepID=UPI0018F5F716|nr:insulinase family protein [Devosia sp. MC532]